MDFAGHSLNFHYPSVGATENTILASCRAKGTTVIKNAAIEPEIIDLVLFLQKLGVTLSLMSIARSASNPLKISMK